MNTPIHRRSLVVLFALAALAAVPYSARASHVWGSYHWARTQNPFTIKVIDSHTPTWDKNLDAAISDWNASSVLNVVEEAGDDSQNTRKRCAAVTGKVRSCNAEYGFNGWFGLARIWTSGSHITQGTAKMNDSYLATGYTSTNWQHVICQEIGHAWGLGHQDESGADLNTCMDYADALDNPHPNQHDYQQLEAIYKSHSDSSNTAASLPAGFANAEPESRAEWGQQIASTNGGRGAIFERELGDGNRIFTFVIWAEPNSSGRGH